MRLFSFADLQCSVGGHLTALFHNRAKEDMLLSMAVVPGVLREKLHIYYIYIPFAYTYKHICVALYSRRLGPQPPFVSCQYTSALRTSMPNIKTQIYLRF